MMRYITRLSVFLLILMSCSFATAAPRYARVLVGTREVVLSPRAVVEGDAVYAPTDILRELGANYAEGKQKLSMMLDEGTQDIDIANRNGTSMIRLDEIAKQLNLDRSWDDSTSTLILCARLVSVDYEGSTLTATFSAPVKASNVRLWKEPWRLSVDFPGTKLGLETRAFNVGGDVTQVRAGQFEPTTARVTMDLSGKRSYKLVTTNASREIKLEIVGGSGQTTAPATQPSTAPAVITPAQTSQPAQPVAVTAVTAEKSGDKAVTLRVSTSGTPKFTTSAAQTGMAVDIQNATLQMDESEIGVNHPLLKAVKVSKEGSAVRLSLEADGYPVFYAEPSGNDVLIRLRLPSGAGGKLKDKTIVVDAGHGGKDPGARGGGVNEKTLNLQLAQAVKEALEAEGVNVVLTRYDDRFIELASRPAVADQAGGDIFVSIHCNAIIPERYSGTDVYYHTGQESSRALASAVHDEIIRSTGMKDNGIKRDTIRFKSGFAVLRNANVPAILIESGYIDCTKDRDKLCDPDFRKKFAAGVVDGLRMYVEGKTGSEE